LPPLLFIACGILGHALLTWARTDWLGPAERFLVGTGLGLGVLVLWTLGLGLVGWMNVRALPLVMLLIGLPAVPRLVEELGAWARGAGAAMRGADALMVGLAAALAVLLVFSAWAPPVDYDEMEYHLALPKAYLEAGRIHETPHNVYSYLPQGAEMLFQAAMSLRWFPEAPLSSVRYGSLVARTLNAYLAVLIAAVVAAGSSRLFGPRAAAPAAALYLGLPAVYDVSYRAMAENAQVLFSVMTMVALAGYFASRRPSAAALAGILTGLALGTKYLVWGFVFAPVVVWLAGEAVLLRPRGRGVRALALFIAMTLLVASPWMIRNYTWTGNPGHPLLTGWFGPGPHWTAAQAANFQAHHSPASLALGRLVEALAPEKPLYAVPVALALACGAVALARGPTRRPALLRVLYAAAVLAVWWFGTHHVMRHLVPVWPPVAMLAAGGWVRSHGRGYGRAVAAACVTATLAGMLVVAANERERSELVAALSAPPSAASEARQYAYSPHVMQYLNLERDLPPGAGPSGPDLGVPARPAAVGFVGEAQTLEVVRPVLYNTVWDTPWLAPAVRAWRETASADAVRAELARLGVATIYVNWLEIERFRRPGNYGWPAGIDEALFEAWTAAGVLEPIARFGLRRGEARPWPHVLYRVLNKPRP